MRYIDLSKFVASLPRRERQRLRGLNNSMIGMADDDKKDFAKNGNRHWSPIKTYLEKMSRRKCWYTESKNPGFPNEVEHFRPKGQVVENDIIKHWYWFLAFNPDNYRLSCQFPNRLNVNLLLGETGGKGDKFPLIDEHRYATTRFRRKDEQPILLDPCNENDVNLLNFNPDGRPTVSALFQHDQIARERVEKSNLLLNLDYPTFNEERETLYNEIRDIVTEGDEHSTNTALIASLSDRLNRLMHEDSAYSKASECYIRCFRDREWVEALIV